MALAPIRRYRVVIVLRVIPVLYTGGASDQAMM